MCEGKFSVHVKNGNYKTSLKITRTGTQVMAIQEAYCTTFRPFNVLQECKSPVWFIGHKKETEDEICNIWHSLVALSKLPLLEKCRVYTSAVGFLQGRAMAQVVSLRPINAEAWGGSQVNLCGICRGQSCTGTGFSPISSVFPASIAPLRSATHIIWGTKNITGSGSNSEM
jgi:hypothetical protein